MTDDPAYFLYHSIGQYPGRAEEMAAALSGFAQTWAAWDGGQWGHVLGARGEFLDLWGTLIEAPAGTLAPAENVTVALYSVLTALPDATLRGKRVLIAADCFPSLHFMLAGLQERMGFTLHTVPYRDGARWVADDDMIAAWDDSVALALITFVTSTASHRTDVGRMLAHGRAQGSLVALDITQGIGLLPFSLREHPVDMVVSTTLKWLCGTPGAGVVYVNPTLTPGLEPELRGWFSQDDPFQWGLDQFGFAPDARRFEHGTPGILASLGSIPALRWHAQQTDVLRHNRMLTDLVITKAQAAGLDIASPTQEHERGGSVMLHLPDGLAERTVAGLRDRQIFVDRRGDILRISPGTITNETHVDRLFDGLNAVL